MSTILARLKTNWSKRTEAGAGGLLPIITIGMIIVIVAGFIAASTSYAAKISGQQVAQMTSDLEENSLVSAFVSSANLPTGIVPASTVEDAGSYQTYYSTAEKVPVSIEDPEVSIAPSTGYPADARWIILEMTTESGSIDTAVFSYTAKGARVVDNLISWNGAATITNSELKNAPGTLGAVSAHFSSSNSTKALTLSKANVKADLYAEYAAAPLKIAEGTVRGLVSSKTETQLSQNPALIGDVYSSSRVTGAANIAGTTRQNDNSRPLGVADKGTSLPSSTVGEDLVTLVAADCATPAQLKTRIESVTKKTRFARADTCAAGSWNVEVQPKADVTMQWNGTQTIRDLKVKGSEGSLSFVTAANTYNNLTLNGVKYTEGAKGFFSVSFGSITVMNSDITGAIVNYQQPGGTLSVSNSSISYAPVSSPLTGSSSQLAHLVRVS